MRARGRIFARFRRVKKSGAIFVFVLTFRNLASSEGVMTRKSDREAEAAFVGMYGARPKTKYHAPPPAGMPLAERLRWAHNGVQAARESSREKTNWEKAADRAIRRSRSSAPAMPEHVFQNRVTSGMERQVPGWGKMTRAERHAKLKELAGIGQKPAGPKRVEGVTQTPYGQIGDQVQFPEGTKLDIGTLGEKLQRGNRTRKQTTEHPVNAADHPPSHVTKLNDTRAKQQSTDSENNYPVVNHPNIADPEFAQAHEIVTQGDRGKRKKYQRRLVEDAAQKNRDKEARKKRFEDNLQATSLGSSLDQQANRARALSDYEKLQSQERYLKTGRYF